MKFKDWIVWCTVGLLSILAGLISGVSGHIVLAPILCCSGIFECAVGQYCYFKEN